jgi:hypothetical protein
MGTMRIISRLFLCQFFSVYAFTHIDAAIEMEIVGGRKVIVVFDAYEGASVERNQVNAAVIAMAMNNMALDNSEKTVHFSYEDPAVYDMGKLLKNTVSFLGPSAQQTPVDRYLSFLPTPSRPGLYNIMTFKKPEKLTTYLAGDLTRALSLIPSWPKNLSIQSNDPRREHYLALIKSGQWLSKHEKRIRMQSLITASPLLAAKKLLFTMDADLETKQKEGIKTLFAAFERVEQQQLEGFANFASIKTKNSFTVNELKDTLYQFKDKISLDTVYDFLSETKQRTDIYSDGPIIDVLLTMFNQQHPDIMVVILGNHLAKKLVECLRDLDVIEDGQDIPDALGFFTRLAKKYTIPSS